MNIGLALKQEELVSTVHACNHTLPAAVPQVRANFGLLLIVWQVIKINEYLTDVLLGRWSFSQKEEIM